MASQRLRRRPAAAELTELYQSFVEKLIDLYARIDNNTAVIGALHRRAMSGERRRLLDAELVARNIASYSAEQPGLPGQSKASRLEPTS